MNFQQAYELETQAAKLADELESIEPMPVDPVAA